MELALQTTLLGLAIAIILALVAALVGPLLIDWGGHRSMFEAEASRLIGVDVRVTGAIEARLLPTPSLTLHDIEIGSGSDKIRARSLGIEFALGPLMRGEWRAAEMHLVGPQLSLGLDATGHVLAPKLAINFSPDNLSIDRLSIEDGKVTLTDAANGAQTTLDRLWFNGEARSLLGPFKGEGAVTVGGETLSVSDRRRPLCRRRRAQAPCQRRSGQSSAQHRSRRHAGARGRRAELRRHV